MFFRGDDCEAGQSGSWGRELAATGEGSFDMSALHGVIAGDFYRETQDTARGLTMDAFASSLPSEAAAFGEAWHHSITCGADFDSAVKTKQGWHDSIACANLDSAIVTKQVGQTTYSCFQEGDSPPLLPTDSGFALSEVTTVYVKDEAAWCAVNRLLTFLTEEVFAHIQKVNRQKFTVKAEVLCQNLTCVIKVRVYRLSLSAHALEFHRRGGDSVAFSGLFRRARVCLCPPAGNDVQLPPAAPLLPPSAAQLEEEDADSLVTPLIDAACHSDDAGSQASAVAGLAEAAEDAPKRLCRGDVFTAIRRLVQVRADSFEVSSQVSRLLSKLVSSREADAHLAGKDDGMLCFLLEKVCALTTGQLLRRQLATALLGLVKRTGTDAKVSPKAADELAKAASA